MKQSKISKAMQKLNKFPLTRVMGLMIVLTTAFSASFAKYVSNANGGISGDIVKPIAIYKVEQEALDPFADANYTANLTTVERTSITVSNTEQLSETEKRVSTIGMEYQMIFYVPTLFAQSAAIQLTTTKTVENTETEAPDDYVDVEIPVTPMLVLNEFQKESFTSNTKRFEGVYQEGIDSEYAYDEATKTYSSASATHAHSLKVEEETQTSAYQHIFPTFIHGTDDPLVALLYSKVEEVHYQKITISCEEHFSLPANVETTHKYTFRVFPTKQLGPDVEEPSTSGPVVTLPDQQFLMDWKYLTGGITQTALQEVLEVRDTEASPWSLTVNEDKSVTLINLKDPNNENDDVIYENVDIGKEIKIAANEDTSNLPDPDTEQVGEVTYNVYHIASGKYYPCRLNVVFTQTSNAY